MKVNADMTLNGSSNVGTMATRLRDLADLIETTVDDMQALGSSPPSIPNGNNLVFAFFIEANL